MVLKVYSLTQQHRRVGGELLETQLLGPAPEPGNSGPEPSKPSRPVWGMLTASQPLLTLCFPLSPLRITVLDSESQPWLHLRITPDPNTLPHHPEVLI